MGLRTWWERYTGQPPEPERPEPARTEPERSEREHWDAQADESGQEEAVQGSGPDSSRENDRYASSREHLADELAWIESAVRAQVYLWDARLEGMRPEEAWGSPRVSHLEVLRFLAGEFSLPVLGGEEAGDGLHAYLLELASAWRTHINRRLACTPDRDALRLERLSWWCGLDLFDQGVVLLCLLGELDLRYGTLFAWLQDEAERTQPSPALAVEMLRLGSPEARLAAFLPEGALLRHHLIALGTDGRSPQPLRAGITLDRRVLDFLLDGETLDPALGTVLRRGREGIGWDDLFLDAERVETLRATAGEWRRESGRGMVLLFVGQAGSGREKAAAALADDLGMGMLVADLGAALAWEGAGGFRACVARVVREARFQGALLLWAGMERLYEAGHEAQRALLLRAVADFDGLVVLAGSEQQEAAGVLRTCRPLLLHFPMPALPIREQIWLRHLPDDAELWRTDEPETDEPEKDEPETIRPLLAHELARTFRLNETQVVDAITAAVSMARSRDPRSPRLSRTDLTAGAQQQAARRLVGLARQVEPVPDRTFADLVLPGAVKRQISDLREWIHVRRVVLDKLGFERRLPLGKGLIVLFTGASGTGKTMTASLLAQELGVSLFKVDMAALVSKWVGETEKNLARLFDQAEYTDAVLFFDEADAIFGRRGEVKQAQDRWANMEVNYLLQRIEEFSGVVILTTNLRQNIDDAFLRRIQVIVDYPFPDEVQREEIWHRSLPEAEALEVEERERSFRALARTFRISGGSIKNIVVDAAFRAYRVHSKKGPVQITLRHLVAATAREYQKLGKPITQAEYGERYYAWVREDILEGEKAHGQAKDDAHADGVAA